MEPVRLMYGAWRDLYLECTASALRLVPSSHSLPSLDTFPAFAFNLLSLSNSSLSVFSFEISISIFPTSAPTLWKFPHSKIKSSSKIHIPLEMGIRNAAAALALAIQLSAVLAPDPPGAPIVGCSAVGCPTGPG